MVKGKPRKKTKAKRFEELSLALRHYRLIYDGYARREDLSKRLRVDLEEIGNVLMSELNALALEE